MLKKITLLFLAFFIYQNSFSQFIDGVSFSPIGLSLGGAEHKHPSFKYSSSEDPLSNITFSFQVGFEINKLLHKNVEIFSGLSFRRNIENSNVSFPIEFFMERAELFPSDVPTADESLWIRSVQFKDNYLRVPLGIRYFIKPKKEKGFNLSLAYELDYLHLLESRTSVNMSVVSSFFLFVPIYTRVEDTIYEDQAEQFFKEKVSRSTFYHNLKLGLHYNINERSIIALEIFSQISTNDYKKGLFRKYKANGMNISFGRFF